MKKLLITVCLCTLLLSGCKKEAKLANGEEAVVHINGKDFSANDLYKKLKASYGTSMLINMIDDYIVNVEITDQAEAVAYGKSKVTSEKSKFNSYSSVLGYTWEEYLRNNGFNSEDELAEYFKNNYLKEKVAIKYIIPSITDKEIKKYYEEKVDDKIVARHIIITPKTDDSMSNDEKKKAEEEAKNKVAEIIKLLDEGKDFSELAKEYSSDGSAKDGGLLDAFTSEDVDADFWKAAKALEVGKYSKEPVKSKFGYHVILKEKVIAKDSLENMKETIQNKIAKNKLDEDSNLQNATWFKIRTEYKIDITDSDLKYIYDLTKSQYEK